MALILHLSDLHLGGGDVWERSTDDKVGLVPVDENTRLAVLRTSLTGVKRHLAATKEQIDALVVSGDLTSKHDVEGFQRFLELFDEVQLVPHDRIIVVPGNHDVDWDSQPDTKEKYASFLEHTRGRGMRTPLCDGVDLPGDPLDSEAQPVRVLDDCALVAINSANWCGVTVGPPRRKGVTYDVARVSEAQLDGLTDILRGFDTHDLIRIAILHHHLLPVTEDEEVKPFEAFTNLARLRAWLRDHGFHVVLHGHKHQPALTWDHVYDLRHHDWPARRIFVVSAPRPTSWGAPVCRLLRVGEATQRRLVASAPRILVETIQAERHERAIRPARASVQLDPGPLEPPGFVAIDAPTADAAYERLVHELERWPGRVLNVTCVVRDPESAERPPTNYRVELPHRERWFADAVDWWQDPAPELVAVGDAPFNHGERLYASGPAKGPLDLAAARLGSTKATVMLVRNEELVSGRDAPSFVALQLVRATDIKGDRLDCVGYFRKQDLTLWWPINLGELRKIQKYVLDMPGVKRLRAGRLVTVAAEAIHDYVLPQLAGTLVDRAVDLRPDVLMQMAYGVAHATSTTRHHVLSQWTEMLADVGRSADFPTLGIERLIEHLRVFRDMGAKDGLDPLIKDLQAVADRSHRARRESTTRTERERYSNELFKMVGDVLNAVEQALPPGDSGPSITSD